jgi:hypothetical protein
VEHAAKRATSAEVFSLTAQSHVVSLLVQACAGCGVLHTQGCKYQLVSCLQCARSAVCLKRWVLVQAKQPNLCHVLRLLVQICIRSGGCSFRRSIPTHAMSWSYRAPSNVPQPFRETLPNPTNSDMSCIVGFTSAPSRAPHPFRDTLLDLSKLIHVEFCWIFHHPGNHERPEHQRFLHCHGQPSFVLGSCEAGLWLLHLTFPSHSVTHSMLH